MKIGLGLYRQMLNARHTPELECDAPWHAGKAFAIGCMKALIAQSAELGA